VVDEAHLGQAFGNLSERRAGHQIEGLMMIPKESGDAKLLRRVDGGIVHDTQELPRLLFVATRISELHKNGLLPHSPAAALVFGPFRAGRRQRSAAVGLLQRQGETRHLRSLYAVRPAAPLTNVGSFRPLWRVHRTRKLVLVCCAGWPELACNRKFRTGQRSHQRQHN